MIKLKGAVSIIFLSIILSGSLKAHNSGLKIVSYNILSPLYLSCGGYDQLPYNVIAWELRKSRILEILSNAQFDIASLQEIDQEAFKYLEENLSSYGYVGIFAKPLREKKDSLAVFYRSNRFKLIKANVHKYREYEKNFQEVVLSDLNFRELRVINAKTQWDNPSRAIAQHRGFKQLLDINHTLSLTSSLENTIICGDFNLEPADLEKVDFYVSLNDPHARRNLPTIKINNHLKRIDYILTSKDLAIVDYGSMVSPEAINSSPSITNPSDHLPIFVVIK